LLTAHYTSDQIQLLLDVIGDFDFFNKMENLIETTLDYSKNYEYIGGFKETTKQQNGQIDFFNLGVGDRIYLYGSLNVYTKVKNYGPGLSVATMFPSFTSTISANEIPVAPVPEPSTFLLLCAGLAGLGFVARRRRKE
jgi:hypothetical protein